MKKINKIPLLIALAMAACIMLTACGNGGGAKIYYGSWELVVAPTCTHTGEEGRHKIDDDTQTQSRPVPALGHNFSETYTVITEPTETETGLEVAYCLHGCLEYIEREIPVLSPDGGTPQTPIEVPTPPTIPADGIGIFVIGGYSKFITEARIYSLVKDFESYCNENAIPRAFIGWRMYDSSLNVAPLSAAVRADGDVDVLLGGGNNITSAGNLDTVGFVKLSAQTIYFDGSPNDGTRSHLRLNSEDLTIEFWTYIVTDRAKAILANPNI